MRGPPVATAIMTNRCASIKSINSLSVKPSNLRQRGDPSRLPKLTAPPRASDRRATERFRRGHPVVSAAPTKQVTEEGTARDTLALPNDKHHRPARWAFHSTQSVQNLRRHGAQSTTIDRPRALDSSRLCEIAHNHTALLPRSLRYLHHSLGSARRSHCLVTNRAACCRRSSR